MDNVDLRDVRNYAQDVLDNPNSFLVDIDYLEQRKLAAKAILEYVPIEAMFTNVPDEIFAERVTHKDYGRGVCISRWIDRTGSVRAVFDDSRTEDGTAIKWVSVNEFLFDPASGDFRAGS